jgi:hypothetical protein
MPPTSDMAFIFDNFMEVKIMKKRILNPCRIRRINGGFSFIPHRFLTEGFYACLSNEEKNLYMFLVLASDNNGLSYYSKKSICTYTGLSHDVYTIARKGLIDKDLVEFDGTMFQVLDLPHIPPGIKLLSDLAQQIGKRI